MAHVQRSLDRISVSAGFAGVVSAIILVYIVVGISQLSTDRPSNFDTVIFRYLATTRQLSQLGQSQDTGDDPERAARFSRQTLAVSPISILAVRRLALAEASVGQTQLADSLFSQAAILGWRDGPTQLWLAQAFLQHGHIVDSVRRLDAALRTAPQSSDLYAGLDEMLKDPVLAAALADRMALNPQWRFYYINNVSDVTADNSFAKASIIIRLTKSANPPLTAEVLPLITKMVGLGQVSQARFLWLSTMGKSASRVFDPRFELSDNVGTSPFSWTIPALLGTNVSLGSDEPSGSGLRVSSDGSASGVLIGQRITLNEGPHELNNSGVVPLAARSAYYWDVRCSTASKPLVVSRYTSARQRFTFEVPSGCDSQLVELRVERSPSAAGVDVRFDDLTID